MTASSIHQAALERIGAVTRVDEHGEETFTVRYRCGQCGRITSGCEATLAACPGYVARAALAEAAKAPGPDFAFQRGQVAGLETALALLKNDQDGDVDYVAFTLEGIIRTEQGSIEFQRQQRDRK